MEALLKVAGEKLEKMNVPVNKSQAILPQLMLAVFNEETSDELQMSPNIRQEFEQEILALLGYSDKSVYLMLNLTNSHREQELLAKLRQAVTDKQLREVLIVDLLYNAMRDQI